MNTKILRQKILDLAIRGRLVPQDPNDEPAAVLLQRIHEEKQRLVKEKKLKKKDLETSPIAEEDKPFELPQGWEWCRLGEICYVAAGSTPSKECFVEEGIPYLKMYNLRNNAIDFDFQPQFIKEDTHNGKLQRSRTEVGDIVMNIVGPPLGKVALIPSTLPQANFNQAAVLIRPLLHKEIIAKYIRYYLLEMSEINSISTKGSAGQVNISLTQSQKMRLPLPPLSEQRRIVSAVEKWMSVIDALETSAADLQQFTEIAKKRILDLAIRGKLVPQNSNDEPAAILLENIRKEKEKLVKEKKLKKKDLETTPIDQKDIPFQLPQGWEWCRLDNIGMWQAGGTPSKSHKEYYGGTIPWLKTGDLNDGYITNIPESITEEGVMNSSAKLNPAGSVLIAMYGATIGKLGILTFPATTNQACCACVTYKGIEQKYLFYFLLSHKNSFIEQGGGGAQPNISKEIITKTLIPLPPLSEQRRIVSKVEDLFAAIDTIAQAVV